MGIFGKIKRGRSGEPQEYLGQLLQEAYGFLGQKSFRSAVVRERKRSERSGKPFLLLLLDFTDLGNHAFDSCAKETGGRIAFQKFAEMLNGSLRGIDTSGWYEKGKIIGLVFPETDLTGKEALFDKVKRLLNFVLGEQRAALVGIHCFCFPMNSGGEEGGRERDELYFYPEVGDDSLSLMVSRIVKRVLDVTGSLFGLLLFSPVFVIAALLIKINSPGPIFFRQKRVGFNGRPFTLLKFRSMYVNGDDAVHRDYVRKLIHDGEAAAESEDKESVYKLTNDPRVTAVGRFLRRTSFDELPQFINVFLGHMSIVGPRPAIPYEIEEYDMWHRCRIWDVKPGITGIWQVEGRSRTTFEEMVRMDLKYCRSRSLVLDLKLILKTPLALIQAKGAF
ncbi:MAG: sugar transferase [Chitinispirillales bacterium]|jgi:lipopolysaccharide/colanic/teichoic acid biosynthesis glycosyltransferase|nr:sugar transferase [Chitinispirillales bacterium]